ncbi:Pectinesterase inhibitor domain [Macleaya cordata]|uniref:Pectinesterase inhibitor domain n=1 Tax=Macleaya cordata TaxID=56857 RepID=A0A200PLW6_MACCD|nr:Pectinesterase inhibitor domain [Macleaya cordata]
MSSSAFSFIPICSSLLLFLFVFHGVNGLDLINETCKEASQNQPKINYDFCVASLRSAPGSNSTTTDLQQLGVIATKLTLENATYILSHINNLLKDQNGDLTVKKQLEICLRLYTDARTYLQQAIGDIKSEDFFNAIKELSTVMDSSSTCEDGFNKEKIFVSPLEKQTNDFYQLAAVALQITKYLN